MKTTINRMIVILNNLRSSQNVGAIFRTAEAAGCEKIYCCGITPAPLDRFGRPNSRLLKASLGAEKYLAWEKIKSATKLIDELKKQGYQILVLEQDKKSVSLFDFGVCCCPRAHEGRRAFARWSASARKRGNLECGESENHRASAQNFVLILGNEINGLPRAILNRADKILEIPMAGRKESLNVAVAFGIAIFWLMH